MKCLDCFYALAKDDTSQDALLCEITQKDVFADTQSCSEFLALDADICFNCFHADIDNADTQVFCRLHNKKTADTTLACASFESGITDICINCYHATPSEINDYTISFCALQKAEVQANATCQDFIALNAEACFNCANSQLPDNFAPDTLLCKISSCLVSPTQLSCDKFESR